MTLQLENKHQRGQSNKSKYKENTKLLNSHLFPNVFFSYFFRQLDDLLGTTDNL